MEIGQSGGRRMRFAISISIVKKFLLITFLLLGVNNSFAQDSSIENHYSIMVLSDIHISNDETKDNRMKDIVNSINAGDFKNLDLLVTTGDNVSSFQTDRNAGKALSNQRGQRFYNIISKVKVPYLIALGNHDYKIDSDRDSDDPFSKSDIDTMEVLWKDIADLEPFFSYQHKGWNFIILNSMRGRYLDRFFDDDQMKFLENELQKEMPTLLFFHHPIETDNMKNLNRPTDIASPKTEPEFYRLVKEYKENIKGIFAGHIHRWLEDTIFESVPVYVTDSFADNGSSPYRLIGIDTVSNKMKTTAHEFINN